tara:strand:+ start:1690 stop:2322 length:633 start_codon:yes stop_codon:yes gene_type:complete
MSFSINDHPIILFGNGSPPVHQNEFLKLQNAKTILCIDGGAIKLLELGFKADYILGDMDSINNIDNWRNINKIILKDQSRTDLEKSLNWCLRKGIKQLTLIACSGNRDDHHQINFLLLSIYSSQMKIKMITNFSTIYCVNGKYDFKCIPNQVVSLIPEEYNTIINTTGLAYPIKNDNLKYKSQGISNKTKESKFSIQTNGMVWVILNHAK